LIIQASISEEIVYRLAIQNFVASLSDKLKNNYWMPILLSAVIWTFSHNNIATPQWVKYMQIFPIGIVLGKQFKEHGLESCILTHLVFNIIVFLVP
jgi:membrane protease YdiL (CAAX protease family)